MGRTAFVALAFLAVAGLALAGGDVKWMKLEQAKAAASATGKPICVYSQVDAEGKGC